MKTLHRITYAFVAIFLLFTACGQEDASAPTSGQPDGLASIDIIVPGQSFTPIIPDALQNSQDFFVNQISRGLSTSIEQPKAMLGLLPPQDATISTTPIATAPGGRAAGDRAAGELLAYRWELFGSQYAHQVTTLDEEYRFAFFYKLPEFSAYVPLYYITNNKTGSAGTWAIYALLDGGDPTDVDVALEGHWTWNSDAQDYSYHLREYDFNRGVMSVKSELRATHLGTGEGNYELIQDNQKLIMEWDATGAGTWTRYVDGEIDD